jgi:transposase
VRLTIRRFEASGLSWPVPDDVTDTVLEARLFGKAGSGSRQGRRRLAEPDWALVHRELKRKHVTLSIVWEEYIAGEPGGYRYSRYVAPGFMLLDRDRAASSAMIGILDAT